MPEEKKRSAFAVSATEWKALFRFKRTPGALTKAILVIVGLVLSPITLIGVMLGYVRSYNRFLRGDRTPDLYQLPTIVVYAMILGGIAIWGLSYVGLKLSYEILTHVMGSRNVAIGDYAAVLLINTLGTFIAFSIFKRWRVGMHNLMLEGDKFGTAQFAVAGQLSDYLQKPGLYLGSGFTFDDKGHILTVAGTRGGKGTNLIIPNLLGVGGYSGSWVVIDPKAENAAITARYQRQRNNVVILNPWGLLEENVGQAQSYNPLDIVKDKTSIHLIDDIQIVAEMIVPIDKGDRDKFFTDNARSIVAGLLLHLVTTDSNATLTTLWQWVRLPKAEWDELLADMAGNDDPVNGEAVNRAAYEILKLQAAGDKTFGSIIATVLQSTDFLKSHALQKSLVSGFNPQDLSDGKTTLYIIIPADKLQSHARWLRLITITALRAVVRKPNKRVTFLLDEFAALGYLSEIQNALSTYAGFNITVWPILQSLIQLKGVYGDIWETFIANATIRQFFSINDNFTAEYVSTAMGKTTNLTYTRTWWGVTNPQSNQRDLATADEVRRTSGKYIFAFMAEKPPTFFFKQPYYDMNLVDEQGKKIYDENPYFQTPKNITEATKQK